MNSHIRAGVPDPFDQHFGADISQEDQGDPGDQFFESAKVFHNGVDTDPTGHGHQCLKETEYTGDETHLPSAHGRLIQTVGKGNRKGIHGQTDSQKNTVKEKNEAKFHLTSPELRQKSRLW